MTYDKWLGNNAKPSNREIVRAAIDAILAEKPKDFSTFIAKLEEAGYTIKHGKHITLSHPNFKKAIRMNSLGEGYTEADLRAVFAGEKVHTPKNRRDPLAPKKNTLLIDIEAKLREGKGAGYERWAKVHNLKQMAQTVNYLREHGLLDYAELEKKAADATARYNELSEKIKSAEKRMAEIAALKTHIINYSKTREIYTAYRKAGYSKKFLAEHESAILLHKAAKKAFDEANLTKLPTVKSLQTEFAELLTQKKAAYTQYRTTRDEMRELLIHKANVERILREDVPTTEKQAAHERK